MSSKRTVTVGLIAAILILSAAGCKGPDVKALRAKVTPEQVTAFKNQKTERRVDIYIPIKEQYSTSRHSESLKTLRSRQGTIEPRCYQCMSTEYNIAPANQKPDPTAIKLSITCAVCHELTAAEFKLRLNQLDTCTSCHNNGSPIVAGSVVHHPQKEMFLGYGAIGVPQIQDAKYKSGLTCIECHMPNEAHTFQGKTPKEAIAEHTESICVMCHADQSEAQFAQDVDKMQQRIKTDCANLEKDLKYFKGKIGQYVSQGRDVAEAKKVYDAVYTNISFIQADRSMGIHNFAYTTRIIENAKQRKAELEKLLKEK